MRFYQHNIKAKKFDIRNKSLKIKYLSTMTKYEEFLKHNQFKKPF